MDKRFEFQQLFPNLQWEVIMKMSDPELVNLCRSSHAMENFCNTREWFWRDRIKSKFNIDPSDPTIQQMLHNNGNSWFGVYFVLIRLSKLKEKLSPHLNQYNLPDLYNLQRLDLEGNKLTELPSEIGNLINLRELDLSNNRLLKLPSEIGQLVNLRDLHIRNSQLTELPREIGNLTNLETLYLTKNKLTELPSEIGNLTNLHTLSLAYNKLTELPEEISNLTGLQSLYIMSNKFKSPGKIKQLLPNVYLHL